MTDLWRLGATEIAPRVAAGELSAVAVTEQTLARLAAVNPTCNAVVQQMPEAALAAAAAVDAAVAAGNAPGPLAGVPVTIKVNVDQQGFATTNGLRIQRDLVAEHDSPVVANLRRAGAIIVGRTNTPAFSMRWFTRNSLHGHTLNPRDPGLTPGGSSGGAAAAVAAGIGAIGHGTDIAGSIRYPAYACGLHGIRPSVGRVPAVNRSAPDRHIGAQITAVSGPLARSVADLGLALAAMAAPASLDPWWVPAPLAADDFPRRAALCVNPDDLEVDAPVERALRDAAAGLVDAGWTVDETPCPPLTEAMHLQMLLWMSEFAYSRGEPIAREDDPDANFVYAQLRELCAEPTMTSLMEALQARVRIARDWQLFFADYPLLLCPVSAEMPFADQLDVASPDSLRRVVAAQLTQIALPLVGVPAMSVCTGAEAGAPLGVQLVGPRFREDILLAAAADIEARCPPVTVTDSA